MADTNDLITLEEGNLLGGWTADVSPIEFLSSLTVAQKALVSSVWFDHLQASMLYVYDSTKIYVESITLAATTLIHTAVGAISNVAYYKGRVYYIFGGEIYRATLNLNAPAVITPVAITSTTGDVLNFSIYADEIFASDGTDTYKSALDGTGWAILLTGKYGSDYCFVGNPYSYKIVYLLGNQVKQETIGDIVGLDDIIHIVSDGTNLYVLDTDLDLRKITLDSAFAIVTDTIIGVGLSYLGNYNDGMVSVVYDEDLKAYAYPAADTESEKFSSLITSASLFANRYCGVKLAERTYGAATTEDNDIYYDGTGTNELHLRNFPVSSITSLYIDEGRSFGSSTLIPSTDYVFYQDTGKVCLTSGIFPAMWKCVKISYVAGYNPVPSDLKQAIAMLVDYWDKTLTAHRFGVSATATSGGLTISYEKDIPQVILAGLNSYRKRLVIA